jgi:hypothetical protein
MASSNQDDTSLVHQESASPTPLVKPKPRLIDAIKAFVEHPTTRLVMALILILSGFIETFDTVKEDVSHLRIRVGHGIILLGFVNAFSSLPAVIDGIERWLKVSEVKRERSRAAVQRHASENTPNPDSQA